MGLHRRTRTTVEPYVEEEGDPIPAPFSIRLLPGTSEADLREAIGKAYAARLVDPIVVKGEIATLKLPWPELQYGRDLMRTVGRLPGFEEIPYVEDDC